jgi:hypothetical protein
MRMIMSSVLIYIRLENEEESMVIEIGDDRPRTPLEGEEGTRITDFPVTFASLESNMQKGNRILGNKLMKNIYPFDEGIYHVGIEESAFAVEYVGEERNISLGDGVKSKIGMANELRRVELELENVKKESSAKIDSLEGKLVQRIEEIATMKSELADVSRTEEYEVRIKSLESQVCLYTQLCRYQNLKYGVKIVRSSSRKRRRSNGKRAILQNNLYLR